MDWNKLYDISKEFEASDSSINEELAQLNFANRYGERAFWAEGAMKKIEVCEDLATRRTVAYATSKSTNPDFIESFLREAQITALLQHPNIIPIYDIGTDSQNCFFTMKLIKGSSLAQLLFKSNESTELSGLLAIFIKVCEAVSYAHSRGIVHLDLKPDNIQVSEHGEVIVMDWGLAKIVDFDLPEIEAHIDNEAFYKADVMQNTLFGHIKGTPGFLSPEQAQEQRKRKVTAQTFTLLVPFCMQFSAKKFPSKLTISKLC